MQVLMIVAAVFGLLLVLGWIGLRVTPRPFATFAGGSSAIETVPLPAGLPAPVERYYRQVYGDRVPLIESAVISRQPYRRREAGSTVITGGGRDSQRRGAQHRADGVVGEGLYLAGHWVGPSGIYNVAQSGKNAAELILRN